MDYPKYETMDGNNTLRIELTKSNETVHFDAGNSVKWTDFDVRYRYKILSGSRLIHEGTTRKARNIRNSIHYKGLADKVFSVSQNAYEILSKGNQNPIKMVVDSRIPFEEIEVVGRG